VRLSSLAGSHLCICLRLGSAPARNAGPLLDTHCIIKTEANSSATMRSGSVCGCDLLKILPWLQTDNPCPVALFLPSEASPTHRAAPCDARPELYIQARKPFVMNINLYIQNRKPFVMNKSLHVPKGRVFGPPQDAQFVYTSSEVLCYEYKFVYTEPQTICYQRNAGI
jgi:hypothetical protein